MTPIHRVCLCALGAIVLCGCTAYRPSEYVGDGTMYALPQDLAALRPGA